MNRLRIVIEAKIAVALRHRCSNLHGTVLACPFERDALSYLLGDFRVCRVTEIRAAHAMPPVTADVAVQSVLMWHNFPSAFSTCILAY